MLRDRKTDKRLVLHNLLDGGDNYCTNNVVEYRIHYYDTFRFLSCSVVLQGQLSLPSLRGR